MGHSPRNYAKQIIGRYKSLSRTAFPKDSSKPVIHVRGTVTDGLSTTIGRDMEIGLTLDEAIKLHDLLSFNLADAAFQLGISLEDRRGMVLSPVEHRNMIMSRHD